MSNNLKTITSLFSGHFAFFASLASILGLVFLFTSNTYAVLIALAFFCLMLLAFTSYLIYFLFKILKLNNGNADHENRSTFIKYETTDGKQIVYETYKLLQCKKPILTEMDYNFKWSGSIMTKVTSDLQDVINIVDEKNPDMYDKAILKFKKPLHYNQNSVLHFKAELDDVDGKSLPHVETRVTDEIDIIHYRIILKHKSETYDKNAILERCKMNSNMSSNFEKIKEIAFDKNTKSYEYHLLNPEVQYYYRITWEK